VVYLVAIMVRGRHGIGPSHFPLKVGPLNTTNESEVDVYAPPVGSGADLQQKSNSVYFSLKI